MQPELWQHAIEYKELLQHSMAASIKTSACTALDQEHFQQTHPDPGRLWTANSKLSLPVT